jgi:hypothetical protein
MDWSTVAAAAAGGLIGVLAEMSGRISARRDAARAHKERRAEAHEDHLVALADEERRARNEHAHRAADRILKAFVDNPVAVLDEDSDDLRMACRNILLQLYYSTILIADAELRQRFDEMSDAIDLAMDAALPRFNMAETIFISRNNAYRWLGSYLRGDGLAAPDGDWVLLAKSVEEGVNSWQLELERRHINVRPRRYHDRP